MENEDSNTGPKSRRYSTVSDLQEKLKSESSNRPKSCRYSTVSFDLKEQGTLSSRLGRPSIFTKNQRLSATTCVEWIMASQGYETLVGFIVLLNFFFMTIETHSRAVDDRNSLLMATFGNRVILGIYMLESATRLVIQKCDSFKNMWNNLDYLIVMEGVTGEIMTLMAFQYEAQGQMGILKSLRMIRLLRLLRLLVAFPELNVLLIGIGGCMKTLFWATCLIFTALNVWSILSVEYLSSVAEDLDDAGGFENCKWCRTAFSNVWLANLTWFQIVTGDGWSTLARGMIESYPWTYLFFMTNIVVVMWGLLNLVVAAIVEASMEAREADIASAAKMAVLREEQAFERFSSMCSEMDSSGDGYISIEEFKAFYHTSQEFQKHLAVMGVTEASLAGLLQLMDKDQNGFVENTEFVEQMTRMRTLVMKTEIFSLVRYTESIHATLRRQKRAIDRLSSEMQGQISAMTSCQSFGSEAHCQGSSPRLEDTATDTSETSPCGSENATAEIAAHEHTAAVPNTQARSTDWEPDQWDLKTFGESFGTFVDSSKITATHARHACEDMRDRSLDAMKTLDAHVYNRHGRDAASLGLSGKAACVSSANSGNVGHDGYLELETLKDEIDARFECIMKKIDELPEAVATNIFKHVCVSPP